MKATANLQRTPGTKLGRAVQAAGGPSRATTQHHEQGEQTNWLRDVILGGQDGLVNMLGIVLGVIAGGGSTTVLLSAGFAAAINRRRNVCCSLTF